MYSWWPCLAQDRAEDFMSRWSGLRNLAMWPKFHQWSWHRVWTWQVPHFHKGRVKGNWWVRPAGGWICVQSGWGPNSVSTWERRRGEHACERACKTGGMFPCTIGYNTADKMLTTVPILMDDSLSFKVSNSPTLHCKYSQEECSLPHSKKA